MDDFGAFLVSAKVLDKECKIKYILRTELAIPIANGWQIIGEEDSEEELVTIHTLEIVFPQIHDYLHLEYGTKLEAVYDGDTFVKCIEINEG